MFPRQTAISPLDPERSHAEFLAKASGGAATQNPPSEGVRAKESSCPHPANDRRVQ
jgi:hypothetical protein